MENYIQADDYKLWMIIMNGPYISAKITEDGKTIAKKPEEFDSEDFKKMGKTLRLRSCYTLALYQMSTLVSQSVSSRKRYGMVFAWLVKGLTKLSNPGSSCY